MPQGVNPTWLGGKWGGLSSPLSLEREIGQRPTLTDAHPPWDLAAAFQIHPATLLNYARAKCCHALLLLWVLDKCFSPNPSFYSPLAFPFPFAPVPYTLFFLLFHILLLHTFPPSFLSRSSLFPSNVNKPVDPQRSTALCFLACPEVLPPSSGPFPALWYPHRAPRTPEQLHAPTGMVLR